VPFNGQNWLIAPATPLLPAGESINQKWLLTLTGVFATTFEGEEITGSSDGWATTNLLISPDIQSPMQFGLDFYGVPHPPFDAQNTPFFCLDPSSAPFATVSGAYDLFPVNGGLQAGSGYIVGSFQTTAETASSTKGGTLPQTFQGVSVEVSARSATTIIRLSYNFILRGQIAYLDES
jgi:hypothetical protein